MYQSWITGNAATFTVEGKKFKFFVLSFVFVFRKKMDNKGLVEYIYSWKMTYCRTGEDRKRLSQKVSHLKFTCNVFIYGQNGTQRILNWVFGHFSNSKCSSKGIKFRGKAFKTLKLLSTFLLNHIWLDILCTQCYIPLATGWIVLFPK